MAHDARGGSVGPYAIADAGTGAGRDSPSSYAKEACSGKAKGDQEREAGREDRGGADRPFAANRGRPVHGGSHECGEQPSGKRWKWWDVAASTPAQGFTSPGEMAWLLPRGASARRSAPWTSPPYDLLARAVRVPSEGPAYLASNVGGATIRARLDSRRVDPVVGRRLASGPAWPPGVGPYSRA